MNDEISQLQMQLQEQMRRLRRSKPSDNMVPEGVTSSEMLALMLIGKPLHHEGPVRPGFVASHMHVTKSALSQLLKSLENKGLISRSRDVQDSRAVLLETTPRGMELIEQADAMRKRDMEELLTYLGADDLRTLVALMGRVADYMEARGCDGDSEGGAHAAD